MVLVEDSSEDERDATAASSDPFEFVVGESGACPPPPPPPTLGLTFPLHNPGPAFPAWNSPSSALLLAVSPLIHQFTHLQAIPPLLVIRRTHTGTHTCTPRCSFCSSLGGRRHRSLSIFATFPYSCVPTHAGSPPAALSLSSRVTTTPARGGTGGKPRGARQRQQREPLGALTPSNSLQPAMTPAAFKKKRPDLVKALFAE